MHLLSPATSSDALGFGEAAGSTALAQNTVCICEPISWVLFIIHDHHTLIVFF